ncbi:DUF2975 domain-containing protein [Pedobacter sp. AW1-32]|uniref:DUF2975 domain-containing protein n=1 Tax=Pedobacter sp. AW1-32 TaxID=3383026 RepID=UPI003FF04148
MKIKNQITLIKIGYLAVLCIAILFGLKDAQQGFTDGWNSANQNISEETSMYFIQFVLIMTIAFFGLRFFIYLYRFINQVEQGNVFSEENIRRLFLMGWYCISIPFLLYSYNVMANMGENPISVEYLGRIAESVVFEFWLLIFGITLLTIAFVFKKGIELKQENDLTI